MKNLLKKKESADRKSQKNKKTSKIKKQILNI